MAIVDETKKKQGTAKKVFNTILNVIWAITGGLINAIYFIMVGIGCCFLLFPIFLGWPGVYLGAARLIVAPFGLKIKLNFGHAAVRNIFWIIFGGFFNGIMLFIGGALICCTVVGIPLGLQIFKFAKYMLFPFGATIYRGDKLVLADKKTKQEILNRQKAADEAKKREEEAAKERELQAQMIAQATANAQKASAPARSKYEDLKELKELLDNGIITQEEFDAKKAEIMK